MKKHSKKEIGDAYKEVWDKVWYQRKLEMFENIKAGTEELPKPDIYEGMTERMKKVEKKYHFYGFESELDYGMALGKMSALGWIEGLEWDFLDT